MTMTLNVAIQGRIGRDSVIVKKTNRIGSETKENEAKHLLFRLL